MEKLKTYLRAKKITQSKFAELMVVSQPTVSDWIAGKSLPSLEKAIKIERLTKGAVKANSWPIGVE